MTKDALIALAETLSFSEDAAEAYALKAEALAAGVTEELLAREDLDALIGPGNQESMILNHRNHSGFVAAQLAHFQPQVLVETVAWVLRSYQSHGFSIDYWPVQLEAWCTAIEAQLPEHAEAILPFYRFLLDHLPEFDALNAEALDEPKH